MLAIQYIQRVERSIDQCKGQADSIDKGARRSPTRSSGDGVLQVFGCGHSQMYAEEIFYRAGGLVPVNPILEPSLSLRPTAPKSTWFERLEGYASLIWEHEEAHPGEVVLIASTSGRNAVPVEMAMEAKKRGLSVIALTSSLFSREVAPRHPGGKKLMDINRMSSSTARCPGGRSMEAPGARGEIRSGLFDRRFYALAGADGGNDPQTGAGGHEAADLGQFQSG